MNYIEGTNRDQLVLCNESIDSLIDENNPIRFINAYVEQLNLRDLDMKVRDYQRGDMVNSFFS